MSDDLDEFMQLTGPQTKADEGLSLRHTEHQDAEETVDMVADILQMTGRPVQYSLFNGGYMPTTRTVDKLPPGIYDIIPTSQGTFFMPHDIVFDRLLRLPDTKSDEVINEIEKFWTLKDNFTKFGFIHKRGILLWGAPGSGKTATVSFVIQRMIERGGIVILGDGDPEMIAGMLAQLRCIEPDRPVVLIMEDIDTIIEDHGEAEVLSLLDGERSIDNVVFLATTNYPENLDGRIVNRPSRFDRVVKVGMPSRASRLMYFESRDLGPGHDVAKWADLTDGLSIAHLKELAICVCCYGNDLEGEIARLRKMAARPSSSDLRVPIGFEDEGDETTEDEA